MHSIALLLLAASPAGAADEKALRTAPAPAAAAAVTDLFAVGDVHGDFETFRGLLQSIGLIDAAGHWCGGKRRLVQTGDVLDRGAHSRKVLDLIHRIEGEAKAAGGSVVMLMGNHEVMNICGDLRYVTREEFQAFAPEEKREVRAQRRARLLGLLRKGSPLLRSRYFQYLARFIDDRSFDELFPTGFFAHREAFSPSGRYGSWLLEKPLIHREGGSLFVHAGLSPTYAEAPLDELNRRLVADVRKFVGAVAELEKLGVFDNALGLSDLEWLIASEKRLGPVNASLAAPFQAIEEVLKGPLFDENGPIWYRGLALESERALAPLVQRILGAQEVERIVIGHTQPKQLKIESRLGGRLFLIDTGMNHAVYSGRASALVIPSEGKVRIWQAD